MHPDLFSSIVDMIVLFMHRTHTLNIHTAKRVPTHVRTPSPLLIPFRMCIFLLPPFPHLHFADSPEILMIDCIKVGDGKGANSSTGLLPSWGGGGDVEGSHACQSWEAPQQREPLRDSRQVCNCVNCVCVPLSVV